ncbi:MAG: hypothetical protein QM754_02090 [Tepidisphaeraceae bacterium]
MDTITSQFLQDDALQRLRSLRRTQSWGLLAFAAISIAVGFGLLGLPKESVQARFLQGFGWQCVVWGIIDLVFALLGVGQSVRADRRPNTPQASADEFLAAEKLLRSLRFNQRLNVGYVTIGVVLTLCGYLVANPILGGHGTGVLVQGGFLLLLDAAVANRLDRLMNEPAKLV